MRIATAVTRAIYCTSEHSFNIKMGLFDDLPDVDGPKAGTGQVLKPFGAGLSTTKTAESTSSITKNATAPNGAQVSESSSSSNKDCADKKPSVTSWSATAIMFKPPPTRKPSHPPKPKVSAIAAASTTIKTTIVSVPENVTPIEADPPSFRGNIPTTSGATKKWSISSSSLKRKQASGKGANKKGALAPPSFTDDYDPLRPNEYQYSKDELRRLKHEKDAANSRRNDHSSRKKRSHSQDSHEDDNNNQSGDESDVLHRAHRDRRRKSRHSGTDASDDDRDSKTSSRRRRESSPVSSHRHRRSPSKEVNPAVAPKSLINLGESGDDAYLRRLQMSQQQGQLAPAPLPPVKVNSTAHSGPDVHQRSAALATKEGTMPAASPMPISHVVLLKNMVGPGEVDDTLQDETADECKKYGEVDSCLIYEVPNGLVPDEQAVRIFLKFKSLDGAQKALLDLNGRFFGGRQVVAESYDEAAFAKFDLARGLVLNRR
ncbi:hypothetical protein SeMB42_g05337 [Synchytrium endobioticum]|uniref:RNA recognition motif domain-containing protein n=1 Tax=Synchytrium endobioticum TaxID=286115 RepID=A0A507CSC3_9FUNG|nr:hypothetical protein SeMB42_g05337 [Synchytrium endobioticum]